jgi:hypothetical protein
MPSISTSPYPHVQPKTRPDSSEKLIQIARNIRQEQQTPVSTCFPLCYALLIFPMTCIFCATDYSVRALLCSALLSASRCASSSTCHCPTLQRAWTAELPCSRTKSRPDQTEVTTVTAAPSHQSSYLPHLPLPYQIAHLSPCNHTRQP